MGNNGDFKLALGEYNLNKSIKSTFNDCHVRNTCMVNSMKQGIRYLYGRPLLALILKVSALQPILLQTSSEIT